MDVPNWTSASLEEMGFLKETFSWKDPQIVGGFARENRPRPVFMMHYDANDIESPINAAATCVA